MRGALRDWSGQLGRRPHGPTALSYTPFSSPPREGLAAPIQVAHCVQLIPAPHASDHRAPLLRLATNLLRIDYMYNELRFKGNAYGALCSYSDAVGSITLGSYADPHITRTLKVFADLPDHVRATTWSREEFDRAVISTAKNDCSPIRPESATATALEDHVRGRDRACREERYAALLCATPDEVRDAMLAVLDEGQPTAPICVLSSREKLEAANAEMPDAPLSVTSIL